MFIYITFIKFQRINYGLYGIIILKLVWYTGKLVMVCRCKCSDDHSIDIINSPGQEDQYPGRDYIVDTVFKSIPWMGC